MTTRSPPENPEYTSEPKALSPVSPKPVHFSLPADIPVLDKQIDPVFNQTNTHMTEAGVQQLPSQAGQPVNDMAAPAIATESGPPEDNDYSHEDLYATSGEEMTHEQDQTRSDRMDADSQMNVDPPLSSLTDPSAVTEQNILKASHDILSQPSPAPATARPQSLNYHVSSTLDVIDQSQIVSQSDIGPNQPQTETNGLTVDLPYEQTTSGTVNFQSLLDSLTPSIAYAPQSEGITAPTTASSSSSMVPQSTTAPGIGLSPTVPVGALPSSLPPRPPPQEQPSINPNFAHSRDIRDYHNPQTLNASLPSNTQQNTAYRPTATLPSFPPAPGQSAAPGANGLPPPPLASFQQPLPQIPAFAQSESPATRARRQRELESQREIKEAAGEVLDDADTPWTPTTQRLYDHFLGEERKYVTEGNWEQFPHGSRLFVGNLSSERVTKRDIFHVFHKYGDLAQISIKQAYGFVQFLQIDSCQLALQNEEGRIVRGKKIHLEVSKPQKNKNDQRGNRRSRSPVSGRAGNAPAGVARYVSGDKRNDRNGRNDRGRGRGDDQYRPGRSPSPRAQRGRDRSRDRYDGRYRSRSRSPYSNKNRYRSPSPRRDEDDDLPLPRRAPHNIPDVQIIVLDELDRNFIAWVENAFTTAGIRVDVLLLSPRLSEAAVIRRQILEGVLAVSKVTRNNQQTAKIPLQVFDRRGGAGNVRFEEYDNLDPNIAAQLVLRAKSSGQAPPPQVQYGYGAGTAPQQPGAANGSNISSLITSLDPNNLQKLLGAMQPAALPQQQQPATALTPDLAKLLGSANAFSPQQQHQQNAYGQMPPSDPLAALRANPALAGLLGGQPQQQPTPPQHHHHQQQQHQQAPTPQGQPDMAQILARLGTYRR